MKELHEKLIAIAVDIDEACVLLDWFEAAKGTIHRSRVDIRLAGKLYSLAGRTPPLRLINLFEAQKKKILGAREMMHWLLENKYVVNDTGRWESPDVRPDFMPAMWAYCGGTDEGQFTWLPEWFEEG